MTNTSLMHRKLKSLTYSKWSCIELLNRECSRVLFIYCGSVFPVINCDEQEFGIRRGIRRFLLVINCNEQDFGILKKICISFIRHFLKYALTVRRNLNAYNSKSELFYSLQWGGGQEKKSRIRQLDELPGIKESR